MRQPKAFTLIELLVVIAIIALLLAVLIPALGKAKEQAKDIVCRSHLKGVGMAMIVYLEQNDGRAYNNNNSNRFLWFDANGNFIDPDDGDAYWGVAYKDYAEDPAVFGCPSYQRVAQLIYDEYDPSVARYAGYALNAFFFRDVSLPSSNPLRNNRKVAEARMPSLFIITHDHIEPRIEGDSDGGEQNDMFYIPSGQTVNLRAYRPATVGGTPRTHGPDNYWGIFRHRKKSRGLDNPNRAPERVSQIDQNPNGRSNAVYLDGHTDAILETTGRNIQKSWYTGGDF